MINEPLFKIQKWFFDDIIWEHSSNLNSLSVFDKKDKEKQPFLSRINIL